MSTLARERLDAGIEVLRLDRPQVRNALDRATLALLESALAELSGDEGLRALVVSTTSPAALSAGADVGERLAPQEGVERMEAFARLYAGLDAFPVPTVAVCVGHCVGAGAEIVTACDLRVAGDNLRLAWPGGRLGVPVGPARLVPLVGLSRAKELILTGRAIGMEEALAIGLVHRTAPAERAEEAAIALAGEVAAHPADGLRRLKALFAELEGGGARTTRENEVLVNWQRHGAGLPSGRARA